jgi:Icc protein
MRLAWLTDLHLNFLDPERRFAFMAQLRDAPADAFLLGGDIYEANGLASALEAFEAIGKPVYFVLGNHDYYRGSVAGVRRQVRRIAARSRHLVYLSDAEPIALTPNTALAGHDGWGDGTVGDAARAVMLNDDLMIQELAGLSQAALLRQLRRYGEEAAEHLASALDAALPCYRNLYVLIHVPPFREACWHEGRISDEDWLPRFTCGLAGQVLRTRMQAHPDHHMVLFCGHTHSGGFARILPNLEVHTARAEYGNPRIERFWEAP